MATITTTFTAINGMLVHEDRGGVETEYVSDPLGSLVECRNSSGTKTYDAAYWPYGEVQTSTGSNSSPWGYVGLLGYFLDSATMLYVRARYLMTKISRWLTVDPLWPHELPFQYVQSMPTNLVDPSGLEVDQKVVNCLRACAPELLAFYLSGELIQGLVHEQIGFEKIGSGDRSNEDLDCELICSAAWIVFRMKGGVPSWKDERRRGSKDKFFGRPNPITVPIIVPRPNHGFDFEGFYRGVEAGCRSGSPYFIGGAVVIIGVVIIGGGFIFAF